MMKKKIYVTVPSLPPLAEYMETLQSVWNCKILTNNGEVLQNLERKISQLLNVDECLTMTNGTVALQLAIRALGLKGEIITTPFTWIATASAIRYEGCTPIFVDIQSDTFNIDPNLIEAAITDKTVAIMPVHVFSNPCDVEAIEVLARKYRLKVIYDAAHAFGVDYDNQSIMNYGDISCCSFHATKLFNTGEGGACFSKNEELRIKLKQLRFFGYDNDKNIISDGCNGKMTEFHAAMGIANLKYYEQVLQRRKEIFNLYFQGLNDLEQIKFQRIISNSYNFSYMPIVLETEELTRKVEKELNKYNVFPRRYFYPSLDTLDCFSKPSNCSKSQDIASRILCLPSHNWLKDGEIKTILKIIKQTINRL